MSHAAMSVIFNAIPFIGPAIDGAANPPPPNMQPQLDAATANLTQITNTWQTTITNELVKTDVDLNNLVKLIVGDGSPGSDYASINTKYAEMGLTENVMMLDINMFFLGLVVTMILWYLFQNKTG
jgi:hypothetical protein